MAFQWMRPTHVMVEGGDSRLKPMSEFNRIDPGFSVPDMQARVSNLMIQFMYGLSDGDMQPLRPYVTEGLLKDFQLQADQYRDRGQTLNVVRPAVLRTEVLGYRILTGEARVHVRTQTRAVLYVTDASGRVAGGSEREEIFDSKVWEFSRALDEKTGHISGLDSRHCPSCGAPVDLYASARCGHCGTLIRIPHFGWRACELY